MPLSLIQKFVHYVIHRFPIKDKRPQSSSRQDLSSLHSFAICNVVHYAQVIPLPALTAPATATAIMKDSHAGKHPKAEQHQSQSSSLFNVLFYTLFLPLTLVVLYGKGFTPEAPVSLPKESIPMKSSSQKQQVQPETEIKQVREYAQPENIMKSQIMGESTNSASLPDGITTSSKKSSIRQTYANMTTRPQNKLFERKFEDPKIEALRARVDQNPKDPQALVTLANNLGNRNRNFNENNADGEEILWCYEHAVMNLESILSMNIDQRVKSEVELMMCATLSYYGIAYKYGDSYDESVEVLTEAASYKCSDEDMLLILERRGQSYLILGKYAEAGQDFKLMYDINPDFFFKQGLLPLNQILNADSSSFPGGWEACLAIVYNHLPKELQNFERALKKEDRESSARNLQKMHHLLFSYFDTKGDSEQAWSHFELSLQFKGIYTIAPWKHERDSLEATRFILRSILPKVRGSGIDTRKPIFLIGFPRSGTTLLERILDAHPDVAGLGESSALASRLFPILQHFQSFPSHEVTDSSLRMLEDIASKVINEMELRWNRIVGSRKRNGEIVLPNEENPLRLIDKLNTNHRVVPFIHMLFPNALILHCARNPMDSVYSSYKHDFFGKFYSFNLPLNVVCNYYEAYK